MTTRVDESNDEGIPEVVYVDESEVSTRSDLVDIVAGALHKYNVHPEGEDEVGRSVWLKTAQGIVIIEKDYDKGAYEITLKQLNDKDADSVASHIIDTTEVGGGSGIGDTVEGTEGAAKQASHRDVGEAITEEEYTTDVGVSSTSSNGGDVAAEITVYEDGTYDLTNMKGGNNHEANFSAIVAIQDMGREDEPLIPLMITEDGWSPAISTVKEVAEMVEDRFMDRI